MAFAALYSLWSTLECFANFSRDLGIPTFTETSNSISEEMEFLQLVIDTSDERSRSKRGIKALEKLTREALHQFEDVVDSVRANMILISQSHRSIANEPHVEEVSQGINSFVKMVKKINKKYGKVFGDDDDEEEEDDDDDEEDDDDDDEDEDDDDDDEEEEDDDDDDDDEDDVDDVDEEDDDDDNNNNNNELVGVSDELTKIKDQLSAGYKSYELKVVSFVGVAGTGRSYFARTLFDEEFQHYGLLLYKVWVSVGPKYEFKEILESIFSQMNDHLRNGRKLVAPEGDEKLFEYLCASLKSRRYLIVLDDVREIRVWEYLKKLFPDENNGSRVFLTTHLEEVALFAKSSSIYPMRILKKEESWNLLSIVLFPKQKRYPPEFEKAGKKIAEKCGGLPVEVAKVAVLLSKAGKKPEKWKKVAAQMENPIAKDTYDEILEISKITGDDILPKRGSARIIEKVLGLPDAVIEDAKYNEFPNEMCAYVKAVALVGMAGIGKTALARQFFEDPWTLSCYEHRVWLTLGPKYDLQRLRADIVTHLDPIAEYKLFDNEESAKVAKHRIRSIVSGKRWLIVFDDVWDDDIWDSVYRVLGNIKCEVLLTTRLVEVTFLYFGNNSNRIQTIPFLNKEESWNLLRKRVFGEELCPHELEKAGMIIAEECDGLPLTIVTVANFLSTADKKTPEYWTEVATKKNSVFEDAYRKISKVLYASYKNLDLEYRTCFLYMAAFLLKYDIPISKLFILCTVEGLLHSTDWNLKTNFRSTYLGYLASKSLVLINNKRHNGGAKTCRLHSVFWHFCAREARNNNFLHVINRYADGLAEDIEHQRRLCIQNNVLFAIKDVYNSMASVSTARSLLCFGPPHQYQVPLCTDQLKLLKVLDALAIRFYEFPVGIFKLFLLRYLALTYDGKFPDSISKLWNLEFLIIQQHMSVRYPGDSLILPMEIWNMKELKHLQIMGRNLPDDPRKSRARLEKLLTLLDVRAESCTQSILERTPNLKKLGIRIELEPNAFMLSFSFDCISYLKQLKSLRCVIVNPELISVVAAPPASFSMLPKLLNKVSLSGLGYSWEHMRPFASLPYLLVLKLKCYAFQGAEWVMREGDFSNLQYLLLEDTDLVHWRADDYCHLNSLQLLIVRNCYKLKDIPWHCLPYSCKVELLDCNPSTLMLMPENYSARVYSSWEVRNSST